MILPSVFILFLLVDINNLETDLADDLDNVLELDLVDDIDIDLDS